MRCSLRKLAAVLLMMGVALLAAYFFGIEEKPFWRQSWFGTAAGTGLGALGGAVLGLIVGGLGVATGGVGFALGPLALTLIGAASGSGIGSWLGVFTNPRSYDFNPWIIGPCLLAGGLASWLMVRWIGSRCSGSDRKPA